MVAKPPAVQEEVAKPLAAKGVIAMPPAVAEMVAKPPADQEVITKPSAEEVQAKSSQEEDSDSENEQKSAPISRHHNHFDLSTKLVHDVPPHASMQMPSLIKSAFGFNQAEIDKFEDFADAKDYFYKKLSFFL